MIHRIAEDALKRLASQYPVVGVTGPRQSGKTTLAKAVFPNKNYVTFDAYRRFPRNQILEALYYSRVWLLFRAQLF